jgi:hypothetical protein
MTRMDSYRLHGPVLFSHPDVFRPSKAGVPAVLIRYASFGVTVAGGAVLAIAGVGAVPVLLIGAGMLLHVVADILTLRRFIRGAGTR